MLLRFMVGSSSTTSNGGYSLGRSRLARSSGFEFALSFSSNLFILMTVGWKARWPLSILGFLGTFSMGI